MAFFSNFTNALSAHMIREIQEEELGGVVSNDTPPTDTEKGSKRLRQDERERQTQNKKGATMQGFTILGDGDNKAILPKSLLGTLREAQVALRELDNAKEVDIDSITSLKDIDIEKEKFVEALYYAFFEIVVRNKNTLGNKELDDTAMDQETLRMLDEDPRVSHILNGRSSGSSALREIHSLPQPQQTALKKVFQLMFQYKGPEGSLLRLAFMERGIDLNYYIIGCFQALCNNGTTLEYEKLLPKHLLPTGVNLEDAVPELIRNVGKELAYRATNAIFDEQGIFHESYKEPNDPEEFIENLPEFLRGLTAEMRNRYNIDFIAILAKVFMDNRFFPLLMQENTKEEGLTITDFTLRLIEQTMQANNMSLKAVLEELFVTIDNEATLQKLTALLHTDSKLCLVRERECMEYEFEIPDEYREDIVSALEGVFEKGYNASQEFQSLFEKFEDILIDKSDYAGYSESEKEVVTTLRTMHETLTNALISLNGLLNAQSDTSPRAQRRLYLKHIKDTQEILATLPVSNAQNNNTQIQKPKITNTLDNYDTQKTKEEYKGNAFLKEADLDN